ncbi:MAG: 30S ribosomal protein S8 [Deltaproteobacteria bacterium]|nr:30S ribosomal protein S8 [Deltaproteobacteria bacterium]
MTDPIADFLTRIRNAIMARKTELDVPSSRLKRRLAEILRDEGFIASVTESAGDHKSDVLSITLRWDQQNRAAICGLRRVSKPGQRNYVSADSIPRVRGGLGTAIVSTSKGVMTDRDARKAGVGGEVLCEVW